MNKKIGKMALRYMVFWKLLENDCSTFITLSNQAQKELDGVDRMYILADLGFGYAHAGKLEEAGQCLAEMKEKYAAEEELIRLLGEDISDMEWQIAEGMFKSEDEEAPLITDTSMPEAFSLSQNYPNPGNPTTTISFQLPESRYVTLTIFNLLGQQVKTLVAEQRPAGSYTLVWDGRNNQCQYMSSGIYLYRLHLEDRVLTKKLILLR